MRIITIFGILVWLLTAGCVHFDRVGFFNTSEYGEVGILVDGKVERTWRVLAFGGTGTLPYVDDVNDMPFHGPGGNDIHLKKNFISGPGELIGYTHHRPPRVLQTVSSPLPNYPWLKWPKKRFMWTEDEDHVWLTFGPEHVIDVSVWIVAGASNIQDPDEAWQAQEQAIHQDRLKAQQIWATERQGVTIGDFKVVDRTDVQVNVGTQTIRSRDYHDFVRCQGPSPDPNHAIFELGLMEHIGFDEDRVNVYLVKTVEGLTAYGIWCSFNKFDPQEEMFKELNIIVMGESFGGPFHDLLVHELGHAFDLGHIDPFLATSADKLLFQEGDPQNDVDRNVMRQDSVGRYFLTEGQTFRAAINKESAINEVYGLGQKLTPERECGDRIRNSGYSPEDVRKCPLTQKRIWPDLYVGPSFLIDYVERVFPPL